MAFVNEYISAENIAKYDIDKINKMFWPTASRPSWTVDYARNIYLRYMGRGREEDSNKLEFTFFWKGVLLVLQVEASGGVRDGEKWLHYNLLRFGEKKLFELRGIEWPDALMADKMNVMEDLKQAFVVYKDFGVHSNSKNYTTTFGF